MEALLESKGKVQGVRGERGQLFVLSAERGLVQAGARTVDFDGNGNWDSNILRNTEHAALLVVAWSINEGRAATVKQVLLFLAGRLWGLFRLALLVLLRVLLNLLPFVLLLLLVYRLLLSDYDINYYLAEKPPEWRWAVVLGTIVAVAAAANLLRLFINWVFCLPLQLLSSRSPARALTDSRKAARGHRGQIGTRLLAWLVITSLLATAVSALLSVAGMYLIPHAAASIEALLLALSLVSLTGFVLYFAITFGAASWLSLLIREGCL